MRDKRDLIKEIYEFRLYKVGHTWPHAEIGSNDKDDYQGMAGTLGFDLPRIQGPGALITASIPDIASPPSFHRGYEAFLLFTYSHLSYL